MISRTKACLKVLAAKQVELQKGAPNATVRQVYLLIDYGCLEMCIVCVLRFDVDWGVGMKRVLGEWQVDRTRSPESIVLVVGWRLDAIWVETFRMVGSSFRSEFR